MRLVSTDCRDHVMTPLVSSYLALPPLVRPDPFETLNTEDIADEHEDCRDCVRVSCVNSDLRPVAGDLARG